MKKQILALIVLSTLTMGDVLASVENNRGGRNGGASRSRSGGGARSGGASRSRSNGGARSGGASRSSGNTTRRSPSPSTSRGRNTGNTTRRTPAPSTNRGRSTGNTTRRTPSTQNRGGYNTGRNNNRGPVVTNRGRNNNTRGNHNTGRNGNRRGNNTRGGINTGRNGNRGPVVTNRGRRNNNLPRPANYRRRNYNPGYRHAPRVSRRAHVRHYTPSIYYRNIYRDYRSAVYLNWIFYPSTRVNGYYYVGDYPYYVYNGYRHRYSHYDTCNYQLVDSYTNSVSLNYWNRTCAVGYDMCANERDLRNSVEYDNRYFCAETFRDRYYNF